MSTTETTPTTSSEGERPKSGRLYEDLDSILRQTRENMENERLREDFSEAREGLTRISEDSTDEGGVESAPGRELSIVRRLTLIAPSREDRDFSDYTDRLFGIDSEEEFTERTGSGNFERISTDEIVRLYIERLELVAALEARQEGGTASESSELGGRSDEEIIARIQDLNLALTQRGEVPENGNGTYFIPKLVTEPLVEITLRDVISSIDTNMPEEELTEPSDMTDAEFSSAVERSETTTKVEFMGETYTKGDLVSYLPDDEYKKYKDACEEAAENDDELPAISDGSWGEYKWNWGEYYVLLNPAIGEDESTQVILQSAHGWQCYAARESSTDPEQVRPSTETTRNEFNIKHGRLGTGNEVRTWEDIKDEKLVDDERIERFEKSDTVVFDGKEMLKGDVITIRHKEDGNEMDVYVLTNCVRPTREGTVVQRVDDENKVFRIVAGGAYEIIDSIPPNTTTTPERRNKLVAGIFDSTDSDRNQARIDSSIDQNERIAELEKVVYGDGSNKIFSFVKSIFKHPVKTFLYLTTSNQFRRTAEKVIESRHFKDSSGIDFHTRDAQALAERFTLGEDALRRGERVINEDNPEVRAQKDRINEVISRGLNGAISRDQAHRELSTIIESSSWLQKDSEGRVHAVQDIIRVYDTLLASVSHTAGIEEIDAEWELIGGEANLGSDAEMELSGVDRIVDKISTNNFLTTVVSEPFIAVSTTIGIGLFNSFLRGRSASYAAATAGGILGIATGTIIPIAAGLAAAGAFSALRERMLLRKERKSLSASRQMNETVALGGDSEKRRVDLEETLPDLEQATDILSEYSILMPGSGDPSDLSEDDANRLRRWLVCLRVNQAVGDDLGLPMIGYSSREMMNQEITQLHVARAEATRILRGYMALNPAFMDDYPDVDFDAKLDYEVRANLAAARESEIAPNEERYRKLSRSRSWRKARQTIIMGAAFSAVGIIARELLIDKAPTVGPSRNIPTEVAQGGQYGTKVEIPAGSRIIDTPTGGKSLVDASGHVLSSNYVTEPNGSLSAATLAELQAKGVRVGASSTVFNEVTVTRQVSPTDLMHNQGGGSSVMQHDPDVSFVQYANQGTRVSDFEELHLGMGVNKDTGAFLFDMRANNHAFLPDGTRVMTGDMMKDGKAWAIFTPDPSKPRERFVIQWPRDGRLVLERGDAATTWMQQYSGSTKAHLLGNAQMTFAVGNDPHHLTEVATETGSGGAPGLQTVTEVVRTPAPLIQISAQDAVPGTALPITIAPAGPRSSLGSLKGEEEGEPRPTPSGGDDTPSDGDGVDTPTTPDGDGEDVLPSDGDEGPIGGGDDTIPPHDGDGLPDIEPTKPTPSTPTPTPITPSPTDDGTTAPRTAREVLDDLARKSAEATAIGLPTGPAGPESRAAIPTISSEIRTLVETSTNGQEIYDITREVIAEIRGNIQNQPESIQKMAQDGVLDLFYRAELIDGRIFIFAPRTTGPNPEVLCLAEGPDGTYNTRVFRFSGSDQQFKLIVGHRETPFGLMKGQEKVEVNGREVYNTKHHYVQSGKLHPAVYAVLESLGEYKGKESYSPIDYLPSKFLALKHKEGKYLDHPDYITELNFEEEQENLRNPEWKEFQDYSQAVYELYMEFMGGTIDEYYDNPMLLIRKFRYYIVRNKARLESLGINVDELIDDYSPLFDRIAEEIKSRVKEDLTEPFTAIRRELDWRTTLKRFETDFGSFMTELFQKEMPKGMMPDFEKQQPLAEYKKGDITIREYQVHSSDGDVLIFAMASDEQGRYYIDNIYDPTVGVSTYGTPQKIVQMGYLVYKPIDYSKQAGMLPGNYERVGGDYLDISKFWSDNVPVIASYQRTDEEHKILDVATHRGAGGAMWGTFVIPEPRTNLKSESIKERLRGVSRNVSKAAEIIDEDKPEIEKDANNSSARLMVITGEMPQVKQSEISDSQAQIKYAGTVMVVDTEGMPREVDVNIELEKLRDLLVVPNNELVLVDSKHPKRKIIDKKSGKVYKKVWKVTTELNPEGSFVFRTGNGTVYVVARVGEHLAPFYRAELDAASGRSAEWRPFFGQLEDGSLVEPQNPRAVLLPSFESISAQDLEQVSQRLNTHFDIPAEALSGLGFPGIDVVDPADKVVQRIAERAARLKQKNQKALEIDPSKIGSRIRVAGMDSIGLQPAATALMVGCWPDQFFEASTASMVSNEASDGDANDELNGMQVSDTTTEINDDDNDSALADNDSSQQNEDVEESTPEKTTEEEGKPETITVNGKNYEIGEVVELTKVRKDGKIKKSREKIVGFKGSSTSPDSIVLADPDLDIAIRTVVKPDQISKIDIPATTTDELVEEVSGTTQNDTIINDKEGTLAHEATSSLPKPPEGVVSIRGLYRDLMKNIMLVDSEFSLIGTKLENTDELKKIAENLSTQEGFGETNRYNFSRSKLTMGSEGYTPAQQYSILVALWDEFNTSNPGDKKILRAIEMTLNALMEKRGSYKTEDEHPSEDISETPEISRSSAASPVAQPDEVATEPRVAEQDIKTDTETEGDTSKGLLAPRAFLKSIYGVEKLSKIMNRNLDMVLISMGYGDPSSVTELNPDLQSKIKDKFKNIIDSFESKKEFAEYIRNLSGLTKKSAQELIQRILGPRFVVNEDGSLVVDENGNPEAELFHIDNHGNSLEELDLSGIGLKGVLSVPKNLRVSTIDISDNPELESLGELPGTISRIIISTTQRGKFDTVLERYPKLIIEIGKDKTQDSSENPKTDEVA